MLVSILRSCLLECAASKRRRDLRLQRDLQMSQPKLAYGNKNCGGANRRPRQIQDIRTHADRLHHPLQAELQLITDGTHTHRGGLLIALFHFSFISRVEEKDPIFNILCKKVMIFNTLKNVVALQTLIFRIFVRPLVGGLKRIQTTVLVPGSGPGVRSASPGRSRPGRHSGAPCCGHATGDHRDGRRR